MSFRNGQRAGKDALLVGRRDATCPSRCQVPESSQGPSQREQCWVGCLGVTDCQLHWRIVTEAFKCQMSGRQGVTVTVTDARCSDPRELHPTAWLIICHIINDQQPHSF